MLILIEIICIPRLCIDKNINFIHFFCLSISRIILYFEYPFCKWIKRILMICSKPRQTLLNLTTDGLVCGSWCGFEINDLRYCNNCNVASLSNLHLIIMIVPRTDDFLLKYLNTTFNFSDKKTILDQFILYQICYIVFVFEKYLYIRYPQF